MSKIELVNEQGCVFDEANLDSSDAVIEWAYGRNGATRIIVDGEPLIWYVRADNESYEIMDAMGDHWQIQEAGVNEPDFWASLAAYDEEHETTLWDLIQNEDVVWLGGSEAFPRPITLTSERKDVVEEVVTTKTIGSNGRGLMVTITREARMLGLGRGDIVEITLRRRS